jgi:pilus assembly protein CpaE
MEIVNKNEREGKIISFFSTKGGVGKSVIAFNYALKLASSRKKNVLLIDGDFLFGDVAVLVDEKPIKTIYNAIEDMAIESFDFLKEYIIKTKYKIDVLLAPKRPENAESITKDDIIKIIELVKTKYDYIIIDLGTNFDNNTLTFLDICGELFFITTTDLMSVKNTKLGIDVMKSLDYDNKKIKIIINKYEKNGNILENDLKKYINFPIFFTLPEDRKIIENSINTGVPIDTLKLFSKSKFEKALIKLIEINN